MGQRTCSLAGCGRRHVAKGYCDRHYRQILNPKKSRARERICEACLKPYRTKRDPGRARVCSPACRWFIDPTTLKSWPLCQCLGCERWVPKRKGDWCSAGCASRARNPPVERAMRPRFHAGWCRLCKVAFVDVWNDRPAHYCSPRCSRRDERDRRRARKKAAYVAPVHRKDIYERDRWQCQICNEDVDREAEVPHPWAAVIDHVIPLAKGGTHQPSNVQCAHYWCNSVKGDGTHLTLQLLGLTG